MSTRLSRSSGSRSGLGTCMREDGVHFTSFLPAISKDALKKISAEVRSWRLHRHMEMTSADIARWINPKVSGLDATISAPRGAAVADGGERPSISLLS